MVFENQRTEAIRAVNDKVNDRETTTHPCTNFDIPATRIVYMVVVDLSKDLLRAKGFNGSDG